MPWTTLVAVGDSSNKKFNPATGWVSAAEVRRVRGTFEQGNPQYFKVAFAYQVANSDGSPGTVYEVGTPLAMDGFNYGTLTDVSGNTDSKQLVRFGWNVWYDTGGNPPIFGRVGGIVEYDNC